MALGMNASCSDERQAFGEEEAWARERREMVEVLRRYGLREERILQAMSRVRRHAYIPEALRRHGEAYGDHPCPIGYGQTISQPYIVAYMTEKLELAPGARVLEVGTGSGYQAAVLAELGAHVFSVELVPELAQHARTALAREGYTNAVQVLTGDGYRGWPEQAPFDAIIVTCAPDAVPPALVTQLREGGRFIIPVGNRWAQRLILLRKNQGQIELTDDLAVQFVPMVKGR